MSLAPWACDPARTKGRLHAEPAPTLRTDYQRDRDRVIHSSAFRRLEYKTQVFVNHEGDLFRTRLTHSLEVAQIGRTVARSLRLEEDLVEAICLAHDLGHTPFGHAGQDALNACMQGYGGFEHNFQSLRIVDELEDRYAAFSGLNLTFETREGILKHCSEKNARTLGALGERFLARRQPSLEAQLANIADEIAYNNHDVDDGLRSGLITVEQLRATALFARHHDAVLERWPQATPHQQCFETIRRMINELVLDLTNASAAELQAAAPTDVEAVRNAGRALIHFSADVARDNQQLKAFLNHNLYRHHLVYRMTAKAKRTVTELFAALLDDPRLMPPKFSARAAQAQDSNGRARVVADYVAGMTDRYAIDEYERIFVPRRVR
ncbi:MAG: deoxyguanosinetriphosphate triphosphohydrolase [Nevskiaceae bacterium]|nr:MAG: deoxyguanosinetriphosphate triphosphohydrolase [Nevskiaceae bacterium]TBR72639.1 MAG: deoxyguanosinetriphosphate triphosphohydrolase [Nevskiaceae bacterium]